MSSLKSMDPKCCSSQQAGTLRATSVKRGMPKAALAAGRSPSRHKVMLKSVVRDSGLESSVLAPVPKRARPTTRSPALGKRRQAAPTANTGDEEHAARIREGRRVAIIEESLQAVAVVVLVSPPPLPPPGYRPDSVVSTASARRKRNMISPLVGSVARGALSNLPTAESSQVYTCSADDHNNQHCTMLFTDEQFP